MACSKRDRIMPIQPIGLPGLTVVRFSHPREYVQMGMLCMDEPHSKKFLEVSELDEEVCQCGTHFAMVVLLFAVTKDNQYADLKPAIFMGSKQ